MRIGQFTTRLHSPLVGILALISAWPSIGQAQHGSHKKADQSGALIQVVRDATERFKDVEVAKAEGYVLQFGCVSGPDAGAMGLHFVNDAYVRDGVLDPTRPEIVIYEPLPNERHDNRGNQERHLELIGADYLLLATDWDKDSAPELMGQLLHLFETPNRFLPVAFYTLHVWAWKENPNGAFVNWHPNVSCEFFVPSGVPAPENSGRR
jgi:hypothetical protein